MDTALFHKDVFLPKIARRPVYEGALRYGEHSLKAAASDKYGGITLPKEFTAVGAELIEAEILLGYALPRVIKQVWRQQLDQVRDLVLVITESGFVKTVWVNVHNDKHTGLNRSRYHDSKSWGQLRANA